MRAESSAEGFENRALRLASGLTFPEELLILSLRRSGVGNRRTRVVAHRSVGRALVLLAMTDLMLLGRMRQAGHPSDDALHLTEFGDSGTQLAGHPLETLQRELTGAKTPAGWIRHHRAAVEALTRELLVARGLLVPDEIGAHSLSEQGRALGAELREGYREILSGELLAPPAEALWLVTVDHAWVSSKAFRDGPARVKLHSGFRRDEPLWFTVTDAAVDIRSLFTALSFAPQYSDVTGSGL